MPEIAEEKDLVLICLLYDLAPLTLLARVLRRLSDTTLAEHEPKLSQLPDFPRTKELVEARHVLRESAVLFNEVIFNTIEYIFHSVSMV